MKNIIVFLSGFVLISMFNSFFEYTTKETITIEVTKVVRGYYGYDSFGYLIKTKNETFKINDSQFLFEFNYCDFTRIFDETKETNFIKVDVYGKKIRFLNPYRTIKKIHNK
jgi:hypothetical protein